MWESIPRQVDKKSRGDRCLEFSRKRKGHFFFFFSPLHSLVLVTLEVFCFLFFSLNPELMITQQTTQFKLCNRDYIETMYPTWEQFLLPENLLLLLLLQLLSRFSRVRLCATPKTAAHQAPWSLGFSRHEHWSGLPLTSPMHEREKWKWSRSIVLLLATPWTAAYQAPPPLGFSRQEGWSGVLLPSLKTF